MPDDINLAPAASNAATDAFIDRWQGVTASELSTSQSFLIDLCRLLDVDAPHPTPEQDYMFERPITFPAEFLISWVMPFVAVILFWLYKQATPGKMVVSARVMDAQTGNPMSVGQAIGRYLAYFISMIPLFLGIIWVAFDPKKQGWHDKLASTVVVRSRNRGPEPVRFDRA